MGETENKNLALKLLKVFIYFTLKLSNLTFDYTIDTLGQSNYEIGVKILTFHFIFFSISYFMVN